MNALITRLNSWGESFLDLAGPMLWQSSLLVLVLFALDLALRRKVRPAMRYALWLVLLVKLLLPPTLAVPTSIAWWIRPSPIPQPPARQFVVTYSSGETAQPGLKIYEPFTGGKLQLPRAKLSWRGWFLVGSSFVSLGLLAWMLRHWWQIARLVRQASPATKSLAESLNDTRRILGLRRNVRLRFTDRPMSPAVCGLFRPVIILPQTLAEQLPPNQLRAVLLHELAHLKRGDVWVNCAQALLQVVYWWHPLLWLANARIRRLREEAVDDAVMLALRDDTPSYAPTLLEVAKHAFHRPTTALGLVGIMESRTALRQRIERLVNSDTPRKSGLTILSAVGVLAFSAVAVPMEQAPAPTPKPVQPAIPQANSLSWNPAVAGTNDAAVIQIVRQVRLEGIFRKLHQIRFDQVFYDDVPLESVIRRLRDEARISDPEGDGVNFSLTDDMTGDYATAPEFQKPPIKIHLALTNITLGDVLDAIVKVADRPIHYSMEPYGVVFSAGKPTEPLHQREFKVDRQSFDKWARHAAGIPPFKPGDKTYLEGEEAQAMHSSVRGLFLANGVDLDPPKSVYYSHGAQALLVNASRSDLDKIERLVATWNINSPPATPPNTGVFLDPWGKPYYIVFPPPRPPASSN